MRLFVRADADTESGSGHVMRSLALAQAWQDAGGSVTFATASLPSALAERLRAERIEVVRLTSDPAAASQVIRAAREQEAAWVAVDGYHFAGDIQERIKDAGLRLLWIDDEGRSGPFRADLVVNQNLHADASMYADRVAETRLLLGPRYALLRREFRRWRNRREKPPEAARNVLVTFGGADPQNVTLKAVRALQTIPDLETVIVAGASNPNHAALEAASRDTPSIRLARNVTNMPELMAWADVAVSAGGITCWELAFFGLPAVVVALAENQRPIAERLDGAGIAVSLGWHAEVSSDNLAQSLSSLLMDRTKRMAMAQGGRELVDGEGSARVVDAMLSRALTLRPAGEADCRLLWEWANDPTVRAFSFAPRAIPWEEHVAWFGQRIGSPACLMYIAVERDVPVGQIRYDLDRDHATVSVSLAQSFRGRGHGRRIIRLGTERLFAATDATMIHAYVKPENAASTRAFLNAGFAEVETIAVRGVPAVHLVRRRSEDDEQHD